MQLNREIATELKEPLIFITCAIAGLLKQTAATSRGACTQQAPDVSMAPMQYNVSFTHTQTHVTKELVCLMMI